MGLITGQSGRRNMFSEQENKIVEQGVKGSWPIAKIAEALKKEGFDRSGASIRAKCKRLDENYSSGAGRPAYTLEEDQIIVHEANENQSSAKDISAVLKTKGFDRTVLSVQYRMGLLNKTQATTLEELHKRS